MSSASETETMKCQCDWCQVWSPMIKEVRFSLPPDKAEKFDKIIDHYLHIEADANYDAVILDGSWPTSVAILELKLEAAKRLNREREMEDEKVILDYQEARNCRHCSSGPMEPVMLDSEEGPVLKCVGCGMVEHF